MSTIGSIGGVNGMTMLDMSQARALRRPDPEAMASQAFAQIDTSGRGYVEKADLQSAMDATATTRRPAGAMSVDDLFTKLDGDGDGKVTKDEFTSGSKAIADEMRQQYGDMGRLSGGMGGMRGMPPMGPPPGEDGGFTKDELASKLDLGASSDPRSELLSSIVENFDAADSDDDGKVSFREARAFKESSDAGDSDTTTSSTASGSDGGAETSASSDLAASLTQQLTRLLHAYGTAAASEDTSRIAITA